MGVPTSDATAVVGDPLMVNLPNRDGGGGTDAGAGHRHPSRAGAGTGTDIPAPTDLASPVRRHGDKSLSRAVCPRRRHIANRAGGAGRALHAHPRHPTRPATLHC